MSQEGEHGSGSDSALVAEYVLGLLEGDERSTLARRIAAEPALAAELRLWRLRLAALDADYAEVAPPPGVLAALERRLFAAAAPAAAGGPFGWWSSLPVLRGLMLAGYLIAAVAVGYALMQPPRLSPGDFASELVAALQAQEGSGVEFVALYDEATQAVRITSLTGAPVPDRDYELWFIKGNEAPVSMGVVPIGQRREIPMQSIGRSDFDAGTVLAVTLEPKGGSPTGVATGPIVAMGPAVPI